MRNENPRIAREIFGTLPDGRVVERVKLLAASDFEAHIITYGAVGAGCAWRP
jgi:aldose 1-epimerase